MITYNQEKFIAEAIEGVLMQDVYFDVELLIADDASSDNTNTIVQQYIDNHPRGKWINYTRHQENKGMMGNFVWALENCKGKYIALCEGDDYWIDQEKLKKQFQFLEMNKSFVGTYHKCKILNLDGKIVDDYITEKNFKASESGIYDLALYGNFIQTPAFFFRNKFLKPPSYFFDLEVGDFFIYLYLAQFGNFKRLDFTGAIYRYGVGIFTGSSGLVMRRKFKKSLLIAAENTSDKNLQLILKLRFNEDKLYSRHKLITSPIDYKNMYSIIKCMDIRNLLKSILKGMLGVERRRVFHGK